MADHQAVMNEKENAANPRAVEPPSTAASPKFKEALVYAAEAHAGQLRKGTRTPYLADYRTIGDALWSRFNGGKEGTQGFAW